MTKRILLVDDDPNILEVLAGYLSGLEFKVHKASNGEEALHFLQKEKIDILVTDVIMPIMNGIELTKIVNKEYPSIKVLACSGGGESGKLVASLALDQMLTQGANRALMKPFTEEEFVQKILSLTGNK
ncbi:MAG: hypothetical protein Fur0010_11600 [Bdellovibrio sp.]